MTTNPVVGGGVTKKLWFRALLLPLLVLLLVLPLMAFGISPVLYFEGLSYDFRLAAVCQRELGENPVGLVVKDDNSDEEVDLPFWPRELYQGVLDNIGGLGCDVIGFDILLEDRGGVSTESQSADNSLARSLSKGPAAILASRIFVKEDRDFGLIHRYRGPLPLFSNSALTDGFINVNADKGVVRSIALYRPHPALAEEKLVPSFALAIYLTRLITDSWQSQTKQRRSAISQCLTASLQPFLQEVRHFGGAREGKNFFLDFDFTNSPSYANLTKSLRGIERPKSEVFADANIELIANELVLRFLLKKIAPRLVVPRRFAQDEAFTISAMVKNQRLVNALAREVGPLLPLGGNCRQLLGPILNIDFSGLSSSTLFPITDVADKVRLFQRYLQPAIEIRQGQSKELMAAALSPPGPCSLQGRIVDVDGKPIAGASVLFVVPDKRYGKAVSESDGRFSIEKLEAGVGLLSICSERVSYRGVIELTKDNSNFSFLWPTAPKEIKVKGLSPKERIQVKSLSLHPQWSSLGSAPFAFPSCGTKLSLRLSARQGTDELAFIENSFPLGVLDYEKSTTYSSLSIANLRYGLDETTVIGRPKLDSNSQGIRFFIDVRAKGGQWSFSASEKANDKGELTLSAMPYGNYELWRGGGEAPLHQFQLQLARDGAVKEIKASDLPHSSQREEKQGVIKLKILGSDKDKHSAHFVSLIKGDEHDLKEQQSAFVTKKCKEAGFVVLRHGESHTVTKSVSPFCEPKTYLVGTMVQADQDFYATPVNSLVERNLAGVEIHSAAIRTMMNGSWIQQAPSPFWELLIILPYLVVAVGLCTQTLERSVLLWATVTIGYGLITFIAMGKNIWLPFAAPMLLLVICPGTFLAFRVSEERSEAARRKAIFQKFINPQVVEQLLQLEEVALHGERRDLTVVFSDIRGFTTISEKYSPQDVTGMLNEYFNRMLPILHKYEGTLDKFIGDAIMAFFGAPISQANHARRAVVMAIEMIHETKKLAKEREEAEEGKWPPFKIGFGIATGPCQVGLIGSDEVFNYSVIGDTVNLAARLEGLNKTFKAEILVSEATWLLVEDLVEGCFIDEVAVKGKKEKVKVYQIIDFKGGRLDPFLV